LIAIKLFVEGVERFDRRQDGLRNDLVLTREADLIFAIVLTIEMAESSVR